MDYPNLSNDQTKSPKPAWGRRLFNAFKDVLEAIVPAFVLALLLTHFVVQTTIVDGQSMEPSLFDDQRLIVEKISYRFQSPGRGDVVVIKVDDSPIPLLKRVIGLPAEKIEIKNNQMFVNDQLLPESYLPSLDQRDYGPTVVPQGYVFVMGDNRNNSRDSRAFGPVQVNRIVGRAMMRYWPLQTFELFR